MSMRGKRENETFNTYIQLVRDNEAMAKSRVYSRQPTLHELKSLATEINNKLAKKYIHNDFLKESSNDTVAVCATDAGLVVAVNNKSRIPVDTRTSGRQNTDSVKIFDDNGNRRWVKYGNFGFHDQETVNLVVDLVKESKAFKDSNLRITAIECENSPRGDKMLEQAKDHATYHAETKIINYCEQSGETPDRIGTSKSPCTNCKEVLNESGVYAQESKDDRVTHWEKDCKIRVVKSVEQPKVKVQAKIMSENIPKTTKGFIKNTKDHFANGIKPGASVGVLSGLTHIVDTIENENYDEYAGASLLNKRAGIFKNKLDCGKVAYANASVFEAKAGVGGVIGGGVSALSASAHAEYGLNNSIGANATVVRAQGNVGPVNAGVGLSLDTSASIGVNGVSASFLGTGFSIGPTLAIKTPFFDFSVSLF